MTLIIFQRIIISLFIEVFYFPLWWFTGGALFIFRTARQMLRVGAEVLSPALWWRYLFVPMYGQYNWQGRIISFVVRLVQGIVRGALFLVWAGVVLVLVAAWFVLPFIVFGGIVAGLTHR